MFYLTNVTCTFKGVVARPTRTIENPLLRRKKNHTYKCYMPFKGGGSSTDATEIKKSAARMGQAALLLKLALDAPLSKKVVERTSERSTDARERVGLLASCGRDETQQNVRKH